MPVAVQAHRLAQLLELERREFADQSIAAQPEREVGGAMAVPRVTAVVVALAVVLECKPGQHGWVDVHRCGQTPAMEPDTAPMRYAMDATFEVEPELRPHQLQRLADDVAAEGAMRARVLMVGGVPSVKVAQRIGQTCRIAFSSWDYRALEGIHALDRIKLRVCREGESNPHDVTTAGF